MKWIWKDILFEYICPSLGCFIASLVFAAPIKSLNNALSIGSLGNLNTRPWSVMTGNCLGWCSYAYYTKDPFVLAANLPGLILSFWLNIGAAKLQYLTQINSIRQTCSTELSSSSSSPSLPSQKLNNNDFGDFNKNDNIIFKTQKRIKRIDNNRNVSSNRLTSLPQDVLFLRIVTIWSIIIVCVGWLDLLRGYEQDVIGVLVNINLVFFYGAPLQTMKVVLETKSSDSIHSPTVTMNIINALFWISYGLARNDIIIYGPNGVGLLLGVIQSILCLVYHPKSNKSMSTKMIDNNNNNNEVSSSIKNEEEIVLELQSLPYGDMEPVQALSTCGKDFMSSSSSPELSHPLDKDAQYLTQCCK
mmetsp:Transcript_59412/g.64150  ORF Transcript_59412/g.64150 Transcript_59412/m.64150 type:complete len:359 (-) Transcript_59412:89-1165(-)